MSTQIKEVKWCNKCGRERTATVMDSGSRNSSKKNFILKIFSPGKTRINRKYKCTKCLHEFSNASFNVAIIVPMIITIGLIIALLAFLYTVFYVI